MGRRGLRGRAAYRLAPGLLLSGCSKWMSDAVRCDAVRSLSYLKCGSCRHPRPLPDPKMESMEMRAAFLAANVYSTIGGFTMRKLAPMFITTSILALAAGTAFANTSDVNATDKNGQPTVSSNTNKQPLSYSDKSSTAKGTNAKMDDKPAIAGSSGKALDENTKSYVSGED